MTIPKVPNPSQHIVSFPAGGKKSRLEEPSAVILASDILRWVIPKVGKFPKTVRFGLGARLESAHFDVLEELIRAQYARSGDRGRALGFDTRWCFPSGIQRAPHELETQSSPNHA